MSIFVVATQNQHQRKRKKRKRQNRTKNDLPIYPCLCYIIYVTKGDKMKVGDLVKIINSSDPCHPCLNCFVLVMSVEVAPAGILLIYILNHITGNTELFSMSYLEAA